MKILAGYLAVVNFLGLITMLRGKRARKSEKKLLLTRCIWIISALGGCVGTIAGMYLFHFKDKKLKYVIGLPLLLILQIIAVFWGRSYMKERSARPSSVVGRQLTRIKNLDANAVMQIISYESLAAPETETPTLANTQTGSLSPQAVAAITRFFRDFKYHIDDTSVDGTNATVHATLTNLDSHALAQDVCRSLILRTAKNLEGSSDPLTEDDYYALLTSTMESTDYELVSRKVDIPLIYENGSWEIETDAALQDDLLGGFTTYINDPYLVSAEEILYIYLDQFRSMNGARWLDYLGRSDIFSTYSADHADELDALYTEKISEFFDFDIKSCAEQHKAQGGEATAEVTINSVDLTHVFDVYRHKLLNYASSTEAITSSNADLANATARYLIEAFEESSKSASYPVTIHLTNDGRSWTPVIDRDLTNIFLGDINGALENFIAEQETEKAEQ